MTARQTPPGGAGAPPPGSGDGQGGAAGKKKLVQRLQESISDVHLAYEEWCHASCMHMMAPPNDPVRPAADAALAKALRTVRLAEARQYRVLQDVLDALEGIGQ